TVTAASRIVRMRALVATETQKAEYSRTKRLEAQHLTQRRPCPPPLLPLEKAAQATETRRVPTQQRIEV
ncbi:hypothetical protein KIN20_024022, partial [Parelaphostrongylus tenuis]